MTELEERYKVWEATMISQHGMATIRDGMFQAYAQGWADGLTARAERAETVKR